MIAEYTDLRVVILFPQIVPFNRVNPVNRLNQVQSQKQLHYPDTLFQCKLTETPCLNTLSPKVYLIIRMSEAPCTKTKRVKVHNEATEDARNI